MALELTLGSTDDINIGSAASIDDLPAGAFTILAWVYRASNGDTQGIWAHKGGTDTRFMVRNSSAPTGEGQLELKIDRATTDTQYFIAAGSVPLNAWTFVAATYNDALSPEVDLYTGSLTALATEGSYILTTDGSGAYVSDASVDKQWGNLAGSTFGFGGRLGWGMLFNRRLTLDEIRSLQFRPRVISGCVNYIQFGYGGTGAQPDLSGRQTNGTQTGCVVAPHVPLGHPFGRPLVVPYSAGPRLLVLAAALTSAGALLKQANKLPSGTLTMSGAVVQAPEKLLTGTLSLAGSLVKQANKVLAGTLTSSGTLAVIRTVLLAIAGTLAIAGMLAKQPAKSLAGTLSTAGATIKSAAKLFVGTLTTSGVPTKQANKILAGVLGLAGTVATSLAGAVTLPARDIADASRTWRVDAPSRQWKTDAKRTWRTDAPN